MGVGDIYQITAKQRYLGETAINVYFYEQRAPFVPIGGNEADFVLAEWQLQILPNILPCQSVKVVYEKISVKNLYDNTQQAIELVSHTGTNPDLSTDEMASFAALGFSLQTQSGAVRSGAKRLAGQIEGGITDGVLTGSGILTAAADASDAMKDTIKTGLLFDFPTFFPVIVKRVKDGVPPDVVYRLPENAAEGVFADVASVLFDVLVTTQNTRKIGRGS